MGRLLSKKPCEVTFQDRISDSKITLYFRMPTTEERIAYQNGLVTRKGNKVESHLGATRVKYGAMIMTGFADGAFDIDGPDGKPLRLSSDPVSPYYAEGWKTIIQENAADIIEMLAVHAFEASIGMAVKDEPEEEEESPLS